VPAAVQLGADLRERAQERECGLLQVLFEAAGECLEQPGVDV
jgi:hypothetical protein